MRPYFIIFLKDSAMDGFLEIFWNFLCNYFIEHIFGRPLLFLDFTWY